MASTATSAPHMSAPVVLPSIHEMFPEHLMPRARPPLPPASLFPRNHFSPPPSSSLKSHPTFSFDVLKSDPRGASLQHIASSRPHRRQPLPLPAVRTQPRGRAQSASSGSSDGDDMEVDVEEGEEGEDGEGLGAEEGKKHVCPTCAKRFNRPSSLRIHVNTHTGATREYSSSFVLLSSLPSLAAARLSRVTIYVPSRQPQSRHPVSFPFLTAFPFLIALEPVLTPSFSQPSAARTPHAAARSTSTLTCDGTIGTTPTGR